MGILSLALGERLPPLTKQERVRALKEIALTHKAMDRLAAKIKAAAPLAEGE